MINPYRPKKWWFPRKFPFCFNKWWIQLPGRVYIYNSKLARFPPIDMGFEQIMGFTPKMDGENNGKHYFLMDDLVGKHPYVQRPKFSKKSPIVAEVFMVRALSPKKDCHQNCRWGCEWVPYLGSH